MILFGGEMELIVNENYGSMSIEIFGRVQQGNRIAIIGYDGDQLIEQIMPDNGSLPEKDSIKPLLRMNRFVFDNLLVAFVELANKKKIRTENENLLQGKLVATETHLTDMREMSKKLVDALILKIR